MAATANSNTDMTEVTEQQVTERTGTGRTIRSGGNGQGATATYRYILLGADLRYSQGMRQWLPMRHLKKSIRKPMSRMRQSGPPLHTDGRIQFR